MANIVVVLLQMLLGLKVLSIPTLAVFLSIDCGSSDSFTAANNITWVGDDLYIKGGESQTVQSADNSSSVARQYTTRRVFPTRKKNCYSIGDVGKGERVFLRAYFYYGSCNNNETSSSPTFDLQFDGNHWTSVGGCITDPFYYEVIYLTKFDAVSLCVAQTDPDHIPFISAIQVISLDVGMYSKVDSTYPLFMRRRANYGGDKFVRYPDDKFDRIWRAFPGNSDLVAIKNYSQVIVADLPNKPPESVLQTAIKSSNLSAPGIGILIPSWFYVGDKDEITLYTIFYFSELEQLNSSEQRSFTLYLNKINISDPITPPYGTALEFDLTTNVSYADQENARYRLIPPSGSTLPSIVNAMEIFQIGHILTDGTNDNHVKALSVLQKAFVQLQSWSGDPCLPNGFPWEWVECTNDSVTPQMNLSNYGLQGSLPDFSALDTLQMIDLSNNNLSGEIPSFLGNFPSLNMLNLANNSFGGLIPSSLTNNCNLKLVYSGNPNLCAPNQSSCVNNGTSISSASTSKNLGTTIGIVILVLVLVSF
uniref:Malectin-like domain-containing protein n=1 Tax=Nelumbo nucifera TaxID=4432 RepID=A0A822ZGH9_NELNU|nr:TPA_asm: hypothetical protein HUJ06_000809 [Nelumbo nucifera]